MWSINGRIPQPLELGCLSRVGALRTAFATIVFCAMARAVDDVEPFRVRWGNRSDPNRIAH